MVDLKRLNEILTMKTDRSDVAALAIQEVFEMLPAIAKELGELRVELHKTRSLPEEELLRMKLATAREALDRAHLLTCDETDINARCFICETLEKTK